MKNLFFILASAQITFLYIFVYLCLHLEFKILTLNPQNELVDKKEKREVSCFQNKKPEGSTGASFLKGTENEINKKKIQAPLFCQFLDTNLSQE